MASAFAHTRCDPGADTPNAQSLRTSAKCDTSGGRPHDPHPKTRTLRPPRLRCLSEEDQRRTFRTAARLAMTRTSSALDLSCFRTAAEVTISETPLAHDCELPRVSDSRKPPDPTRRQKHTSCMFVQKSSRLAATGNGACEAPAYRAARRFGPRRNPCRAPATILTRTQSAHKTRPRTDPHQRAHTNPKPARGLPNRAPALGTGSSVPLERSSHKTWCF